MSSLLNGVMFFLANKDEENDSLTFLYICLFCKAEKSLYLSILVTYFLRFHQGASNN